MHLCSYPNSGIPAVLIELERFIDKAITAPRPFTALPWCRYTFHSLFMLGCVQNDGYDVMGILRVSAEENKVNRSFLRTFVQFILALDRYVVLLFVYLWVIDPSPVIVFVCIICCAVIVCYLTQLQIDQPSKSRPTVIVRVLLYIFCA